MLYPILDLNNMVEIINSETSSESVKSLGTVFMLSFNEKNEARVIIENGKVKRAETIGEKLQMYIQMFLRTERDKFKIYEDTEFGMTYFYYRGYKVPQGFILSELKRETEENLKKISVFDSVDNFEAILNSSKLEVSFNLNLKDGTTIEISEGV